MKKLYLALFVMGIGGCAFGQSFSLNDLIDYTAYTPSKFENSVGKRGYRSTAYGNIADGVSYTWHNKKIDTVQKSIFKCNKEGRATIAFQTTAVKEFEALQRQLTEEGYHYIPGAKTELYQKGAITIQPLQRNENDKTVYGFSVERKALPRARDIQFAEDFLQLTSHEYLATVFGAGNIKQDKFYFSEKEVSPCSVLYPDTRMQVIFIWNDEENRRDPAFILVGGQLQAGNALPNSGQVAQNVWQSRQGIYAGMSLNELQRLNGNSINIWDWESDRPGVVSEKNTGTVDFKNLHLVLNCLDCTEAQYAAKSKLLNSEEVLREGRRVYVSSIIVLPKNDESNSLIGMRR
jgi:hypothetical protein